MKEGTEMAPVLGPTPKGWDISVFADEISPDFNVQLREIRRAGLPCLDLRTAFEKNVLDLSTPEVISIRARVLDAGLRVQCIGSPINKHPFNPDDRRGQTDRLKRVVEIAGLLSTTYVRIFSAFVEGGARAPQYDEMRDWLIDQTELAEQASIILLLENDANCFFAFPENAKRLFLDFDMPHLRFVFDFSNAVLLGYPAIPNWFPWIAPFLGGLHVKDSVIADHGEIADRIVPAGQGDGCVREVLRYLVENSWQGPVSLEPHLWSLAKTEGLDGVGQFRASLQGLNAVLEGLV